MPDGPAIRQFFLYGSPHGDRRKLEIPMLCAGERGRLARWLESPAASSPALRRRPRRNRTGAP